MSMSVELMAWPTEYCVRQVLVERLHGVLRPFLLRRLKAEVEKQLPGKHEHVLRCRLSKRQRALYEDYMASSATQGTLASNNFLGILNVLMQLRKARSGVPVLISNGLPHAQVATKTRL